MPEHNLFQIFTNPLNRTGIRYMVTGAVASIIYGQPRLTHDIDLVIELKTGDSERLLQAFSPEEFYCPPTETINLEANRPFHGHFNIIHHKTGFKADFYPLGQDELHEWGMANRKKIEIEGEPFWVAAPEYVILRKLQYYREGRSEKHLQDIASILKFSYDQIDFQQLQDRIDRYSLKKEWDAAKMMTR